jgi:DNA invertase Pin-like site-specific DNA recombinase
LAAVAQFERELIFDRIKDAKRNLRRAGKHQGGGRPFGYQFGKTNGHGRARELIPDLEEQAAIADVIALRADGRSLMYIRDEMRSRGHRISHQLVANTIARHAAGGAA